MPISVQPKPEPRKQTPAGRRTAAAGASGILVMERAKEWSEEVENAFRLQEAGYRDRAELRELGESEPDLWPGGFIKKLRARESLGSETPSHMYFSSKAECADKDLQRVKLYSVKG